MTPAAATDPAPFPATAPTQEASTMDTSTLILGVLTVTLAGVSVHAWRLGNERRDVALLGVCSGLLGLGTAVTVVV